MPHRVSVSGPWMAGPYRSSAASEVTPSRITCRSTARYSGTAGPWTPSLSSATPQWPSPCDMAGCFEPRDPFLHQGIRNAGYERRVRHVERAGAKTHDGDGWTTSTYFATALTTATSSTSPRTKSKAPSQTPNPSSTTSFEHSRKPNRGRNRRGALVACLGTILVPLFQDYLIAARDDSGIHLRDIWFHFELCLGDP